MSEDAKCLEKSAAHNPPKPQNPPATPEPKPALDITDEEWIAASQGCCGRKE